MIERQGFEAFRYVHLRARSLIAFEAGLAYGRRIQIRRERVIATSVIVHREESQNNHLISVNACFLLVRYTSVVCSMAPMALVFLLSRRSTHLQRLGPFHPGTHSTSYILTGSRAPQADGVMRYM